MDAFWGILPLLFGTPPEGGEGSDGRSSGIRSKLRLAPASRLSSEDAALVKRLHSGDRAAVRQLFDDHYDMLADYAASIVRSTEAAEDIVADIFVSLLADPARVSPSQSL